MPRAYLAISIDHRTQLEPVIQTLRFTLHQAGIDLFIFVDQYRFSLQEEKAMMQAACREIDDSDILIAELSVKAIGVGLEAGYAVAKGKPVWYLRNAAAPHSSTVSGIATEQLLYLDEQDLADQLTHSIRKYH